MVDADTSSDEDESTAAAQAAELKLASEGRWEELGLDPPPPDASGAFAPQTISDFLSP